MKTNFTSYFRLTMFFVLLFGGVCQVWGADVTLSFVYSQVGHPDGQKAPQTCNSYDDKDKVVMNSDFSYSGGNGDNVEVGDNYVKLANPTSACSRTNQTLSGNYTFTIATKNFNSSSKNFNAPKIYLNDKEYTYSSSTIDYTGGEEKNLVYTINGLSNGSYSIQVDFDGSGKDFAFKTLTITPSAKYHIFVCPNSLWSDDNPTSVSINYQKSNDSWSGVQAMTLTGFDYAGKKVYGYETTDNPSTFKTLQFVKNGSTYYGAGTNGQNNKVYVGYSSDAHQWTDIPATSNASAVYLVGSFNEWKTEDANYALTKIDGNHWKGYFALDGASSNYTFKVHAVDNPSTWAYQFSGNGYWFNNSNTTATQLWTNNANDQIVPFASSGQFMIKAEYYGNYENHGQLTVTRSAIPQATFAKGNESATGTAPSAISQITSKTITLPENPFSLTGNDFAGWNDGTQTYAAGASYTMGESNVTFTAQWTLANYTLTWDLDGGTAGTGTITPAGLVAYGTVLQYTVAPTKDGYQFNGWSPTMTSGTTTMPANDQTYTAQWTENLATISMVASPEGKGTFTVGGATVTSAQAGVATKPVVTAVAASGYEFVSWAITGGSHAISSTTDNPTTITGDGSTTAGTLTATFQKISQTCVNTLSWEAEDESKMVSPIGVSTCEYYKDKNSDGGNDIGDLLANASDGHFISMKQNAGADSKCIYYHFNTSGIADLTFTIRASSRYRDKSGTVILYSTKQSGTEAFKYDGKSYKQVGDFTQQLGGDVDLQWRDLTHTFNGQAADDYIVGVRSSEHWWTMFYDKFTINASANVFCTKIEPTGYSITYHCYEATSGCPADQVNQTHLPDPLPAAPIKTGYAFGGWYTDSEFQHAAVAGAELEANADLYAKWTLIKWQLYSNIPDGGDTWEGTEMTVTNGVAEVTKTGLGRVSNYQFKIRKSVDNGTNWTYYGAASSDNNYNTSGTAWTLNGAFNVNLTTGAAGSYTFAASNLDQEYPQIVVTYPTAYSITFNDNGADGGTAMTNITNIASGGEETLPAMTRTKTGHRFTGWKDGNDNSYVDGATISNITSNITLTAQWETKVTALTITQAQGLNTVAVGDQLQLGVEYTPSDAAYGKSVTWKSDNTSYLTVDENGLVTGVQAGNNHYITATNPDGVSNTYYITVAASACPDAWQVHMWNTGQSTNTRHCMHQIGSTTEWRTDQVILPSASNDEKLKVLYNGSAQTYSKEWNTNYVPFVGHQYEEGDKGWQFYPMENSIGYFRIYSDNTTENYFLAFQPTYRITMGVTDQSGWVAYDFAQVGESHEYETPVVEVPSNYKSFNYYVGTKHSDGTTTIFVKKDTQDKSKSQALSGINGLSGQERAGHYGKYYIYDNSKDYNWYCQFKLYYVYKLFNEDGSLFYTSDAVYSGASEAERTTTLYNETPSKTGYNFTKWQRKNTSDYFNAGGAYIYSTAADTLLPVFTAKTYTITLDKNMGTSDGEATATFDSKTLTTITHAGNPTGYSLNGYYTTADGDVKVINADGTLVASVEGYTDASGKWIKDDDCNLFAHWTANQHTLAWKFVGGAATSEDYTHAGLVAYGTALVAPTLTKTGYTFNVWTPVVAATMPDNDVTYTASWNVRTYNITYHNIESSEHNNPATYTIESDITLANPTATRTGYTFGGWYLDEGLTNQITRIYQMHEDKNIYAKWNPNQHTLTWETDGDALTGDYTHGSVAYGTTIVAPNTPTKSGFAFVAWTPEVPATMPDNDVTLTATWRVDYCKPYIQLNCKDYDASKVTVNWDADNKATITAHETYAEITNGGAIYLPVALKAGTYNIKVSGRNDKDNDVWLNYFTETSSNSNVTYDGAYYSKTSYNNAGRFGDAFEEKSWDGITVSDGNFLFSITGHTDAEYQWIRIYKANGEPFCPEMYKVNFTQPSQGSTSAQVVGGSTLTTGDEVPEGAEVIFTWAEATGYDFVNFSDGVNTYTQNPCTLTVNSNITITTNIEEEVDKHTLTASVATGQTSWGSVSPTTQQVGEGREASVTAHAETNYRLKEWSSADIELTAQQKTANPLQFTMPTKDVSVTASFCYDSVHNIIATGTSANIDNTRLGGGGTITKSAVDDASFTHTVMQYDYDISSGDYTGYALPKDDGYKVNSKATGIAFWYKTSSNFIYMEVKANGTESAFGLSNTNGNWKYVYVTNANAGSATDFQVWMNHDGKGTYSGQSMSSNTGTVWISEVQATNITSMPDKTVKVNLTVTNDGHGETSSVPAVTTDLATGTQVVLTATPNDGYRFKNWTVGGSEVSTNNPYTYTVNATTTIQANFEKLYTLTINTDAHIHSTTGAGSYAAGESVTVEATAEAGFIFFNWTTEDGQTELSTSNPYIFTMPANDYTIKANSKQYLVYYDITVGKSDNGSVAITVGGESHTGQHILANTDVVLTATGNEGYGFSQWQDGNKDNPRTIKANAENEKITWTATFTQAYQVSVELGAPGREVIGVGKYGGEAQVTLTAVANTQDSQGKDYDLIYHLGQWTVTSGGVVITGHENDNPLTFTMPYSNVSLKATFTPVECVDSFVIQCENLTACLIENDPKLTTKPFNRCSGGGCQVYNDHYTKYHGTGYWDFKEASNMAMYYPVELEPGTYSFTVWNTTDNQARGSRMYIYTPSETDVVLTYDGQNFKQTAQLNVDFYNTNPAYFGIGGTISNITIPERQKVFIALYASDQWSAWDQIVIKADKDVFCSPLSTTDCVIRAGEVKEIPVCGVDNLTIYEGGQANNNDDVEIYKTVKYSRTVTELDKWETFAIPYKSTSITVQDLPHNDPTEYGIYPIYGDVNKPTAGYFYMEELKGEDATLVGRPFASRWEISETPYPQQNVPYIIRFPSAQSNGYFQSTQINYKYAYNAAGAGGASVMLPGKKNATIIEEDYPGLEEKPTFYYYANNTLAEFQLQTSAYILNESGMNFDIVDQPVIPPFHCYVQATQEIKKLYPQLVMQRSSDTTTELVPVSAEEWNQAKVSKIMVDKTIYIIRDGKVYSIIGQPVK